MARTNKLILTVLIVSIIWPPIFILFVAEHMRPTVLGRGEMRDYELQKLLNANRWVIEIPQDKDGWFLDLVCKDGDRIYSSGATSVAGGETVEQSRSTSTPRERRTISTVRVIGDSG